MAKQESTPPMTVVAGGNAQGFIRRGRGYSLKKRAVAGLKTGTLISLLFLALPLASGSAQSGLTAGDPLQPEVDAVFAEWDRDDSPGCIVGVNQDGETLYRQGYGMANLEYSVPLSPEIVSEIGSVSKQFTAAAILILAREGHLSLDDDVRQYIPELQIEEPLTLRRLADHTSGLRDWIGLVGLAGRQWGDAIHTVPEIVEVIARQRTLNFPPGERFLYSNAGYALMLEVVERVSGQPFTEFTSEHIFRSLGMNHTEWRDDHARIVRNRATAYRPANGSFRAQMPFSDAIGSGGLLTTVDDMIRWTEALHSGDFGGSGFLETMTEPGVLSDGREIGWALGLQVGEFRGVREVSHAGGTAGYRAFLAHYPEYGLTVALQCNLANVNTGTVTRSVAEVYLGDRLAPVPEVTDPSPHPMSAGQLANLAGLYRDPATERIAYVEVDGGKLQTRGALEMSLIPLSEGRFRRAGSTDEFAFRGVDAGGGLELRHVGDGGEATVFVRVDEADPSRSALDAYKGRYHSSELDVTYAVEVDADALTVHRPIVADWKLSPTFADGFRIVEDDGDVGSVVFQRAPGGAITGFRYSSGRILHLQFDREER